MSSLSRVFAARRTMRVWMHAGIVLLFVLCQGGMVPSFTPVAAAASGLAESVSNSSAATTPASAVPVVAEAARAVAGAVYGPSLPAGAAAAPMPAPLQSTTPGIQAYAQSDVDCANPHNMPQSACPMKPRATARL